MSQQDQSVWAVIDAVIPVVERMLLSGMPATGKTTAAIQEARAAGIPVFVFTCAGDSTPAFEARGTDCIRDASQVWRDGPMTAARRAALTHGRAMLIVDEIQNAAGDLLSFMLSVLATDEAATLTLPTGEVLPYASGLQVIATMNGDPTELLNEAILSRFPIRLTVDTTSPKAIAALPADLQAHAKATCDLPEPDRRIDVRAWSAFARLREKLDATIAAQAVWGARAHLVLDSIAMASASDG